MNAENKKIAEEIIEKYHNEISLLGRYSDLTLSELDSIVGSDWICLKEYEKDSNCINEAKVSTFVDFLKEFKFYIQGKGSTWPANFSDIDYCDAPTGRHLGEEMRKVMFVALEKANGKES